MTFQGWSGTTFYNEMKESFLYPAGIILVGSTLVVLIGNVWETQGTWIALILFLPYLLVSLVFLALTSFLIKKEKVKKRINWTYTLVTFGFYAALLLNTNTESHM